MAGGTTAWSASEGPLCLALAKALGHASEKTVILSGATYSRYYWARQQSRTQLGGHQQAHLKFIDEPGCNIAIIPQYTFQHAFLAPALICKLRKTVAAALRMIPTADVLEEAQMRLAEFNEKWETHYP